MLDILTSNFEVFPNKTCGLHVHVGAITNPQVEDYRYSRSFPLRTVKNLMQLVTLCEQEINGIHAVHRCETQYAGHPSQLLRPSNAIQRMEQCRDFTTLHFMWMANDLDQDDPKPCLFIENDAYYVPAVHCGGLVSEVDAESEERSRRTIEFRQHDGTADFSAIYYWVKTVVRLLQFSHECGPNGLPAWLVYAVDRKRKNPDTDSFDTISFLKMIGANEQARYYEQRGIYQHPPVENHQLYPLDDSIPIDPALYVPPELEDSWPQIEIWPKGRYYLPAEEDLEKPNADGKWPDLLHRDVEY
jgi:hypothetical protein